ncbi:MAG TPA: hypothetical protein VER03_08180, partial [Bryobacteraceae bacterium]|nr:hypothetical protein [Bryobacteraceae bacterium]
MYCHAYGTILRTNMPSQALTPALPSADALTIHVDRVPALPALGLAAGSRPLQGRMVQVFEKPPDIVMQVDDLMSVVYEQTNRRIHCLAVAHAPDPLIDYWLLRQFIPVARFLWNDAEVLHAGAVKIGENTAAFLAPAYTGKSTLVAEFIARGHKLVSDDHLLVRDTRDDPSTAVQALSSIPFYRDYRTFESLGRHTTQYDPAASRLRVMYVLKIAHPEAP